MKPKKINISWLVLSLFVFPLVGGICWLPLGMPVLKAFWIAIMCLASMAILSSIFNRQGELWHGRITAGGAVLVSTSLIFIFSSFGSVCEHSANVLVTRSYNWHTPGFWDYKISRLKEEPGIYFTFPRENIIEVPMLNHYPCLLASTSDKGIKFVVAAWVTVESPVRASKLAYTGDFLEELDRVVGSNTRTGVSWMLNEAGPNRLNEHNRIANGLAQKLHLLGLRLEAFAATPAQLPMNK